MKNLLKMTVAALLLTGLTACSEDAPSEKTNKPTAVDFTSAYGGNVLVNLQEELYDVAIPSDAASWVRINEEQTEGKALVLAVEENKTGAERKALVTVTAKTTRSLLATVKITQLLVNELAGKFVIEEIYFSGTALAETGKPDSRNSDQYILIRNNSDEELYADGLLLILQSALLSGQNSSLPEGGDFRKLFCAGSAFYRIPGNGSQVPVKAGGTLIIANNAQNHMLANPASWDATKADFEWYDISSNDKVLDTDNPTVKNLDKWFAQSLTFHALHNRGYYGIALAMPPAGLTGEKFLADHVLEGYTYIFHSPNGSDITMPVRNAYGVPNSWIVDAVNTGTRDGFYISPWDASLDAGYAWAGTNDQDPERYGKSVIRKDMGGNKLANSNNSTADFHSNAKASKIAQ